MIHKDLTNHFGVNSVVIDVDTIPPGIDFREYLNKQVSECNILLAIIGDQWIDILNQRRDEPDDFVRIEIQTALERQIPIVPVLVGKASVPSEKNLPPELVGLSNKQATEVRAGADLPAHIKRLIDGLNRLLEEQKAEEERRRKEAEEKLVKEERRRKQEENRKHREFEQKKAEKERKRLEEEIQRLNEQKRKFLEEKKNIEAASKAYIERDQIFISYSHKDIEWLEKLQTMLAPAIKAGKITLWDDTKIKPLTKWREEIKSALRAAKVAVLLVSADFLYSDFISQNELPPLLEAAENEGLKIIWILINWCLYEFTPLIDYQAAHDPSEALDELPEAEQKVTLLKISKTIIDAITT